MAFDYLPLFSSAHTYQTFFTVVGPYFFLVLATLLMIVSAAVDLCLWYFKEPGMIEISGVSDSKRGTGGYGNFLLGKEMLGRP